MRNKRFPRLKLEQGREMELPQGQTKSTVPAVPGPPSKCGRKPSYEVCSGL